MLEHAESIEQLAPGLRLKELRLPASHCWRPFHPAWGVTHDRDAPTHLEPAGTRDSRITILAGVGATSVDPSGILSTSNNAACASLGALA